MRVACVNKLMSLRFLFILLGGPSSHDRSVLWKAGRNSQGNPSATSSVDEGVADMDSSWDPDPNGSVGHGSTASSGILGGHYSATSGRSRTDWKWPARGSTGSSVLMSPDMSQVNTIHYFVFGKFYF